MIHDQQADLITAVHAGANDEDDRANTVRSALKLYINAANHTSRCCIGVIRVRLPPYTTTGDKPRLGLGYLLGLARRRDAGARVRI